MKLVSKETKYIFEPGDIAHLIADNLKVPLDNISIKYVITENRDYMDRCVGSTKVSKIEVTVKNEK